MIQLRQLAAMPGLRAESLRRIADELAQTNHDEIARYDTIHLTDEQVAFLHQQEARAEALAEVETDSAESRFAALETANDVERQLAELKAMKAMASLAETAALPVG